MTLLILMSSTTFAQEENDTEGVQVVGSGVVNPLLETLISTSETDVTFDVQTTGSATGFEEFCAGNADITTAIRPITVEEDTLCRDNMVDYFELLIAYDVMVVVSNLEDDFLACLSNEALNTIFAPSATSINWADVNLDDEAQPAEGAPEATPEADTESDLPDMTVLLPEDNTLSYTLLDEVVSGFGFRADAQSLDEQSILDTVASTSGALGAVSLESALTADVYTVSLNVNNSGCEQPSISSVESGLYPAAQPFYVYVASSAQETLSDFLSYITRSAQAIIDTGYTPVSVEASELNLAIISGEVDGRTNTAEEITYEIQPNLTGTVTVVGASSGFAIARDSASILTSTQEALTINNDFRGQSAGISDFCEGDADLLFVNNYDDPLCETDVSVLSYDLGQQAAVLVRNAGDSYATCLTLDQLGTIWSALSANTITQWSQVSDAAPEDTLTLVGLPAGNVLTEILMGTVSDGVPLPVRDDVAERNRNAAYRAAAVANVSGALTYMSWADYLDVDASDQENVQLVAIDTGNGCIEPSDSTISDGTYPLTRSAQLLVKQSSLATPEAQALVWTIFSENASGIFSTFEFVGGFQSGDLAEFRTNLLAQFEEAERIALAAPEVTPEAEATETTEATEEASTDE
ncbi:MAG: PstS family phosphate ABC transporter substrate-binding protein [Anaerolineae bacterium]